MPDSFSDEDRKRLTVAYTAAIEVKLMPALLSMRDFLRDEYIPAAGGQYRGASPDGSRPGVFFANAYDLSARPKWAMESLFLYEAVPGHHFQGALTLELDDLPRFRQFGGYTAYGEGWGLYAESLEYMYANSAVAEARAVAEAEHFMAIPGGNRDGGELRYPRIKRTSTGNGRVAPCGTGSTH
jgi:uncharacterized protein (DUF885 family)